MNVVQASNITAELLLVRNLDIRGQRVHERDDFDYQMDFDQFNRTVAEAGSEPQELW